MCLYVSFLISCIPHFRTSLAGFGITLNISKHHKKVLFVKCFLFLPQKAKAPEANSGSLLPPRVILRKFSTLKRSPTGTKRFC